MAQPKCIYAPARNQHGYSQNTWNRLKEALGDQVPTRGKFTNVVRNLGLDDTRMVNLTDEGGKRFFGKNIKNVDDLDYSKGDIPSDVVVRVPTKDGERFFVSNKATDTEPKKWILDPSSNELRKHPDWDELGVNVTGMRRFVRDEDGFYRPAREGERGDFLRITNPSKKELGKTEMLDRGIDAIEVDGKYKLIDESSQVIHPNRITEKPNSAAVTKKNVSENPTQAEIAQRLISEYDIPQRIAFSMAGGVVGSYADEEGEFGGTFWGGAIGLMLGSPKVRSTIKGRFTRTDGKGADGYDEAVMSVARMEKEMGKIETAVQRGYRGDPTDDDAVEKFLQFQREIENKKARGESAWKELFKNEFFQSGTGLLSDMGATAKQLLGAFKVLENGPSFMYGQFGRLQTQIFGQQNTKQVFKQTQLDFVNQFDVYKGLSEEQSLQAFGAATDRIIKFNARIEDGRLVYDDSIAARNSYSDDVIRRIDQRLLEDQNATKVVQVTREFYESQGKRALEAIDNQLSKEIDSIGDPRARNLMDEISQSGLSFKQWEQANKSRAKELKLVKNGKYGDDARADIHKKDIDRIRLMIEDRIRFKALEGKYVPQKWSPVKEADELRKWGQRNDSTLRERYENQSQGFVSFDTYKKAQWEDYKARRILALNSDKWTKYELSEDGLDIAVQHFDNAGDAMAKARSLIDEIGDATKREILQVDIQDSFKLKDYVEEVTLNDGSKKWILTTPQRYRHKDMFPNGIYEDINAQHIANSNKSFVSTNLSTQADFFDRPRKVEIPSEFKETNLENLAKFYSDDMGIRISAIENGMYDRGAVQKNWLKKIRAEADPRFTDKGKLDRKIDEIRSWFAVMQNERPERKVGLTPEDAEDIRRKTIQKARNDTFLNDLAKIATFPFNYATTLYSMFTPMILGPFMGSWKSTMGQYKHFLFNPQELKAITDEIEKMGVIQKKFESYAPEYKNQYKEDLLGDPSGWRRKLSNFADNMTEFSANLSIARMVGIDPENLGLARLAVGNMLDISGAEAGLVTMSVFRHVEDLIEAGKLLKKSNAVEVGGKRYTNETLRRQFSDLGITDMDGFIKGSDEFNKFTDYMRGKGSINDFSADYYGQMTGLVNNIVDQYHGRTKLSRPLKWMDNVWGRALSRYSVYAQNFGVQTTANRIYRPLRDWSDRYSSADESVPMMKLAYWASTGNDEGFKKVFGDNWEQAYNDFPVDAVNNFLKVFGTLAVGKAMMITRGGVLDLTGIATNEALGNDDYEAWRNVNKQVVLGTDENGDEFTIADIFSDGVQGYDLFRMFTSSLAGASRLGFGGRMAQVFTEDLKFTGGGIAEMTPLTGLPNDVFQRMGKLSTTDYKDMPRTMGREALDFMLLRGGPFGTFFDARSGINNAVFQKPKNRNLRYTESGTGIDLSIDFYDN